MTAFLSRRKLPLLALVLAAAGVAFLRPGAPASRAADKGPASTPGQGLSVELSGVPQALSLPTEAKENCLITAIVRGGTPAAVWVARAADAPYTVPVPSAGEGKYQLNLADADVLLALRRTGMSGQFRVFVKDSAGAVIQSAPICFELRSPASASFSVYAGDSILPPGSWIDPQAVTRVAVTIDPALPGVTVAARAADHTWTLKPEPNQAFSLALTPEIRDAWRQVGRLQVVVNSPVHTPSEADFSAIPQRLKVPAGGLSIQLTTGGTIPIPGSNGYLLLHCTEVSPSSASLDVTRADQQRVDPTLRIGRCAAFHLHDQQYAYGPEHIEYLGKAGSKVVVRVWAGAEAEEHLIRELISLAREDDTVSMSFNHRAYDNQEMAAQMEELYLHSNAKSVMQLLDAVSDREKTTGGRCMVSVSGRNAIPFRAWAVDKLAEVGWTPQPAPGGI